MEFSNKYIIGFALSLCLGCSLIVSSLAIGLKDRQLENQRLDKQRNVISVSGLAEPGKVVPAERVAELFQNIHTWKVARATGKPISKIDFGSYDLVRAAKGDNVHSLEGNPHAKRASLFNLPNELEIYEVDIEGDECWILPIWGNGLWSTLYGFIALENDLNTVKGLTFFAHGETAGLGGEVDNPQWKAQWPGKLVDLDSTGLPRLKVVKQGQVSSADHHIDGIAGATITSVAVSHMLNTWLGPEGYGPFLNQSSQGVQ
ncbi:MAG: NADH:ubiquinone reductase (Na(+)-transporting) subunit C [Planctomycetes bacterium]|nr:NADH:ubiquinone reductase (Na(+)-transporting) subunit C [Planctomycetota bacterium]